MGSKTRTRDRGRSNLRDMDWSASQGREDKTVRKAFVRCQP